MKTAKKLASLLLALVMVLSLATTAFAATGNGTDNNGKITINNTVKDQTYSIYRIFDLESFDSDKNAYSYRVNSNWTSFINQDTIKDVYVTINKDNYVEWINGKSAADFAAAAIKYAEDYKIEAIDTKSASADNADVVFENLPLGYYLVDSSLGALCALTTTNPNATVTEKNANPSLDKEVKEGENWGETSDANVGDTVEFRATITVQGTAKGYVMHDKMDNALSFKGVTGVTLNGTAVSAEKYEVATANSDSCTFEVKFDENFCKTLKSGDVIVVSYNATLTNAAVVKDPVNNKAHLAYKDNNDNDKTTEDDNTTTYTWELPVLKYTMNGNDKTPLAGAEFVLYRGTGDNVEYATVANNKLTGWVADKDSATKLVTGNDGKVKVEGLDAGTYYLEETDAPAGYNKLANPVKVEISHEVSTDGETMTNSMKQDDVTINGDVEILNNKGTELPSTGGMGTTIFYVLGSILAIGAVVLLVTKKRMSANA